MGRSEWHAGMKKSAHILTDTQTSSSHSDIHIYVNTLHKSLHPCLIKNTHWPPSAPLYFIAHRVKTSSLYTCKHTNTCTLTKNNFILFPTTARKCTLAAQCPVLATLLAPPLIFPCVIRCTFAGTYCCSRKNDEGVGGLSLWPITTLANADVELRGSLLWLSLPVYEFLIAWVHLSHNTEFLSLRVCLSILPGSGGFVTGVVEQKGYQRVGSVGITLCVLSHIRIVMESSAVQLIRWTNSWDH